MPVVKVDLTYNDYLSWKILATQIKLTKPNGLIYKLSWYNLFYKVNTHYWYIHKKVRLVAPAFEEDNLLPPDKLLIEASVSSKSISIEAFPKHQQPCYIFICLSTLYSRGSSVCWSFKLLQYTEFNERIDLNLYDRWKWWSKLELQVGMKIFAKCYVCSISSGFCSNFIYASCIIQA